jgi:hypothetical protein
MKVLASHVIESDLQELQAIMTEIETRVQRIQSQSTRFATE